MNKIGASAAVGAPQDFQLDRFVPFLLNQIFSQMNGNLGDVLRPHGISIHQWRVLSFLKLRGELSIGEITASTVLGQSTISRVVDQLERDGLAQRRPLPENNRIILVSLSPAGGRKIDEVFPAAISVHDGALSEFTQDERELFLDMLHRVLDNLKQTSALNSIRGATSYTTPNQGGEANK